MNVTTHYFSTPTSCNIFSSFNIDLCNVLRKECPDFRIQVQFVSLVLETIGRTRNWARRLPVSGADFLLKSRETEFDCGKATIVNYGCKSVAVSLFYELDRIGHSRHRYIFNYNVDATCRSEKECKNEMFLQDPSCKVTEEGYQKRLSGIRNESVLRWLPSKVAFHPLNGHRQIL